MGIRRVGECGDQVAAGFTNAFLHGVDEIGIAPLANAGFSVGRNVWRVKCADRGVQGRSASNGGSVDARIFGWQVAGVTTGCVKQLFAIGNVSRVLGQ